MIMSKDPKAPEEALKLIKEAAEEGRVEFASDEKIEEYYDEVEIIIDVLIASELANCKKKNSLR